MKVITFKPNAFLLKLSADHSSFNRKKENLLLSINFIVAYKIQQKSVGICVLKEHILQIKDYILHNILVGKDKSVVTTCKMIAPTATILRL
jgi:hypothetical protein